MQVTVDLMSNNNDDDERFIGQQVLHIFALTMNLNVLTCIIDFKL